MLQYSPLNLVGSRHSQLTFSLSEPQAETLGCSQKTLRPLSFFLSSRNILNFSKICRNLPLALFSFLDQIVRTPHLFPLFKTTQDVSYPHERIKISGCTFEFKSNLNSNANQLIPIHLGMRREGAWLLLCMESLHEKHFSCIIGAHKRIRGGVWSWLLIQIQTFF